MPDLLIATSPGPLAGATAFERHVAGAEANVAVGLARLGHSVAYVGRVGADGFGTTIVRTLRGEGVDVGHLRVDDGATTGLMVRERRILGAAQVVYARIGSAGSRLSIEDVDRVATDGRFAAARWLHVSGTTPALSTSAHEAARHAVNLGRTAGLTVSFDVNLRRRLWSDAAAAPIVRTFAEQADVVFGSPDELAVVSTGSATADPEALARAVLDLGPAVAVVKLGSDALALERHRTPVTGPAIQVPAVLDPVGAGDGFCAGFIAGRLDGADIATALRQANACGAAAVAAMGDLTGLPNAAELAGLLAAEGPYDPLTTGAASPARSIQRRGKRLAGDDRGQELSEATWDWTRSIDGSGGRPRRNWRRSAEAGAVRAPKTATQTLPTVREVHEATGEHPTPSILDPTGSPPAPGSDKARTNRTASDRLNPARSSVQPRPA